jgi:nucleoside-diphosphate-sugar epimerase
MTARILIAGATGAIGRQLVPLAVHAGHRVFGSTRITERARDLEENGVEPVVFDVFDPQAVDAAFSHVRPDTLVHLLTDLPKDLNPDAMIEGRVRNARMWSEGTRNLIKAAKDAGTRRVVAQSLAWLYAPGPQPHREEDVLGATGSETEIVLQGVCALENAVLTTPPIEGVVLRYGLLYGPGTSNNEPTGRVPLHVEDAARAALLAITNGPPGVYNIADESALVSTDKARLHLTWKPVSGRSDCH